MIDHLEELKKIESILCSETMQSLSTIDQWIEYGAQLSGYMAYTNSQMAEFKKVWSDKKAKAYEQFVFNVEARRLEWVPASVVKDYITAKCSESEYAYNVAERLSRTITHQLDFVRTSVSALKNEFNRVNSN